MFGGLQRFGQPPVQEVQNEEPLGTCRIFETSAAAGAMAKGKRGRQRRPFRNGWWGIGTVTVNGPWPGRENDAEVVRTARSMLQDLWCAGIRPQKSREMMAGDRLDAEKIPGSFELSSEGWMGG